MNATKTNIPQRLSEKSFRRFEQAIAKVVECFPNTAIELDEEVFGLSQSTLAPRFRDAMASLNKYKWSSEVDLIKFEDCYKQIIVSHTDKGIFAGGREALDKLMEEESDRVCGATAATVEREIVSVDLDCLDHVKILCRIIVAGATSKAVKISCICDDDVSTLEDSYDVRIDKVEGGYLIS